MSVYRSICTSTCLLLLHHTHIINIAARQLCTSRISTYESIIQPRLSTATTSCHLRKMSDCKDFKYEAGTSSVAFVTTPNDSVAKLLAHGLVEQKLAACVNIIPNIQSVYMWEGKVNEDKEYLMVIKTQTNRVEEVTKWVRDNHPYSVAEVITLPIEQGNLPYMKWLEESVESTELMRRLVLSLPLIRV